MKQHPNHRTIGVTGIMTPEQSLHIIRTFTSLSDSSPLGPDEALLMLGLLVSSKTLGGETNKYPWKYPAMSELRRLCDASTAERVLPLVHYATDYPERLAEDAFRIIDLAGPSLAGFQFNIAWPDPAGLKRIRNQGVTYVILQIGKGALEQARTPEGTREFLKPYLDDGSIDSILFDLSGGFGVACEPDVLRPFVEAVADIPGLAIAVAGGFGPEGVFLGSLLEACHRLGCDAEGRLRNDAKALDLARADTYLEKAFRLFCS